MSDAKRVYLDYNATTPCDDHVIEAMLPFFRTQFGNAASRHWSGHEAHEAVVTARSRVAALIGAAPSEIIWTSGATEANNLAIRGVACPARRSGFGRHIVTQATEHKAVLDPISRLNASGFDVTVLPVNCFGRVSPEHLGNAVRTDTALVSIMWANNETGTAQDMASLVKAARASRPDVIFHSDATQAVGKLANVHVSVGVDLMSISAHKLYGPKGCGALYIRRKKPAIDIEALIDGGGHERGMRSGTLNVAGIVGFGTACEIVLANAAKERHRLGRLRDRLWEALSAGTDEVSQNGFTDDRLANTLNVSFARASAESVMLACNEIAMSSGSACTSTSVEPSHVLRAMGFSEDHCFSSIRLSLGRFTTEDDVEYAATRIRGAVEAARALGTA